MPAYWGFWQIGVFWLQWLYETDAVGIFAYVLTVACDTDRPRHSPAWQSLEPITLNRPMLATVASIGVTVACYDALLCLTRTSMSGLWVKGFNCDGAWHCVLDTILLRCCITCLGSWSLRSKAILWVNNWRWSPRFDQDAGCFLANRFLGWDGEGVNLLAVQLDFVDSKSARVLLM